jgi:hypothetical protein
MYAYDAMWSVALGLARAQEELPNWLELDCGAQINCNGAELNSFIRSSDFNGVTGRVTFTSQVRFPPTTSRHPITLWSMM